MVKPFLHASSQLLIAFPPNVQQIKLVPHVQVRFCEHRRFILQSTRHTAWLLLTVRHSDQVWEEVSQGTTKSIVILRQGSFRQPRQANTNRTSLCCPLPVLLVLLVNSAYRMETSGISILFHSICTTYSDSILV